MTKNVKYTMVLGSGDGFVKMINDLLDEGWQLHGETMPSGEIFCQALVKPKMIDNSNIAPRLTFNELEHNVTADVNYMDLLNEQ